MSDSLSASVTAPILDEGGSTLIFSAIFGMPFVSRSETTAAPVPSDWMVSRVSKAGFAL